MEAENKKTEMPVTVIGNIDIEKLKTGLETLTGIDYQNAEIKARMRADLTQPIILSSLYQSEIAAICLGIDSREISILPIKEYTKVVGIVANFLLPNLAEK